MLTRASSLDTVSQDYKAGHIFGDSETGTAATTSTTNPAAAAGAGPDQSQA